MHHHVEVADAVLVVVSEFLLFDGLFHLCYSAVIGCPLGVSLAVADSPVSAAAPLLSETDQLEVSRAGAFELPTD